MRSIIVYASFHHNNTLKIASAISDVLGSALRKVEEASTKEINDYDLVGLGSGIYGFKFHEDMIEFAKNLPDSNCKQAFVFSTCSSPTANYNPSVVRILEKKGYEVLGDFHCQGFNTWGPFKIFGGIAKGHPDEQDIEKAKGFAKKVLEYATPVDVKY